MPNYPQVDALWNTIMEHGIEIKVEPSEVGLEKIFYRKVSLHHDNKKFIIPVDNEYKDVENGNQAVLLHLTLQECEFFEGPKNNFMEWAKDLGFDPRHRITRSLYFDLRAVVPKIRQIIGSKVKAIPHFDMELNTGVMKALRGK